jgi:integral membrane protein (TIGR01906 family)
VEARVQKRLYPILSWLITFLTPLVLVLLGVRLVLNPSYPSLAYKMPAFPDDPYGFSTDERIKWSGYAIKYLLNDSGIEYLAELKFDDQSPVYNEREVGHMLDVKILVQEAMRALYLLIVIFIGMGLWAYFGKWMFDYLSGLSRGGWLTVGLIFGVGLFAAVSFWQFFTLFHGLFFTGDSWLFNYSDTLIRLFPIRFWQDVIIFILGFALVSGAGLGWFCRPKAK